MSKAEIIIVNPECIVALIKMTEKKTFLPMMIAFYGYAMI